MKIYVTHSKKWDYETKLYGPIKKSKLGKKHEWIFPHDEKQKNIHSKELIATSDLILAEVSLPATGMGIELGWAEDRNVPILCISEKDYPVTNALKFITSYFITYENSVDMIQKIADFLKERERS